MIKANRGVAMCTQICICIQLGAASIGVLAIQFGFLEDKCNKKCLVECLESSF